MSGWREYRNNPGLSTMLSIQGWRGGFTESDRAALKRSMETIRNAMCQPVGTTGAAKTRGADMVTDDEWDVAVMTALACSMALVLSGKLDDVEVDADA